MTAETTLPAVVYAAKSTEDLKGSIPTQIEDGRKLAEREGLTVVAEFSDEKASAWKGNRGPGLARALARCEELVAEYGECALIVQHSDRLARGDGKQAKHLVWYALWALEHDVRILSVQDPEMLGGGDYGLLMATVGGIRNTQDSSRKSLSVKDGLRRRAESGKPSGGPPPYGFRWVPERNANGDPILTKNGRVSKILVQDPAQVEAVRRMFAEYVSGRSLSAICRGLNASGIPSSTGGAWWASALRKVLANPVHVGRFRQAGVVYDGPQGATVDLATFEQAAARLAAAERDKQHGGGRTPKGTHLFTRGLLRCARCGEAMEPRSENRQMYRCATVHRRHLDCDMPNVGREEIDAAMRSEIERVYLDLEETRDRLARKRAVDAAAAATAAADAERELARVESDEARIRRDYRGGRISADDWREFRIEFAEERAAATAAAERARKRRDEVSVVDVSDEVLDRLRGLRAVLLGNIDRAPDLDAQRRLLRELFERVVWWSGKLPAAYDLPIPEPESGDWEAPEIAVGESGWLIPILRPGIVAGYEADPTRGAGAIVDRRPLDLSPGVLSPGVPDTTRQCGVRNGSPAFPGVSALFAPIPVGR